MKKKVSISSGSEPDIQALAKELAGLIDRHDECLRRRDYVGAARMKGMIAEFNKRIKYLEEVSKRSLASILQDQPQEVKDRFRRNCTLIILLADLLYSAAVEVENAMAQIGPKHLNVMPVVKTIHENSSALVRLFDSKTDEKFAVEFGDFSDVCYHLLMNRTMAFIEKVDKQYNEVHD